MNKIISKESLEYHVKAACSDLLELAGRYCSNKLSPKRSFILSDFNEYSDQNSFEDKKLRHAVNSQKTPNTLEYRVEELKKEYSDLHDIVLFIFKATKDNTIIEIQYFRKSNFNTEYFEKIKDNPPTIHAKIAMPGYAKNKIKFDVNW